MLHTYESAVGQGSLASWSPPMESIPRQAAAVAKQLLAGVAPASVVRPPAAEPVAFVDWRELRRWNIPEDRLPPGTVTRFREPTFWEQHWATVVGVTALILLQAFLIAVLLFQRRQRYRAEQETQRQRSQLAHAARLATVGELTASIAHEINQPLGRDPLERRRGRDPARVPEPGPRRRYARSSPTSAATTSARAP